MLYIYKDSTDNRIRLYVCDKDFRFPSTLAYNAGGVSMYYQREGEDPVTIPLVAGTGLDSAHVDGAWNLISVGDGWHQLDAPDAAFVNGSFSVAFGGISDDYLIFSDIYSLIPEPTRVSVLAGSTGFVGNRYTAGIIAYIGETANVAVPVFDINNDPVDFTGITLEVCFEKVRGVDTVVIDNVDISVTDNVINFDLPAAVSDLTNIPSTRSYVEIPYSIRKTDNKFVYVSGKCRVIYTPLKD